MGPDVVLNLQQLQKQTQRLIMTPQMQQSIQLLQMNAIELEQLAQTELLENPFLTLEEESPADDGQAENRPEPPEAEFRQDGADARESAPKELPTVAEEPDNAEVVSLDQDPEKFNEVDLNWDDYYSDSENATYTRGTGEDSEERDFTEYTPSRTSLSDHLNWQLRVSSLEGVDAEICEYLIGSLDDDGYLAAEIVQEAADFYKVSAEQVERVLSVLHHEFEPSGIGARSLAECLLIQMKALGSYSELARRVLEDEFVLFQKKKYRELARKLNVAEEALMDLHKKVCRLEPHPGRSITSESIHYIQPDVFVKIIDGELIIYLNEGMTGRLSIDRFYRRLVRQQRMALTQQEKDYAREKFQAAVTLIKNIEKRKSTILRVTEAIMEVQREFLDKGVEALRPLTLREVAEMVGMHESTVARVTSRKYVETPQGTFPLKFFFSSSIDTTDNSDAVSSRSIKEKLQTIISGEDARKPLSDQRIAEMLKDQGFDIARRTVAKYREQLKILPAKYRRQN